MNIEKEIQNLKRQVLVLIRNVSRDKKYNNYDIEAGRINTSRAQRSADDANELSRENEGCILDVAEVASENDNAIMDIAGVASENDVSIMDLAAHVNDLEERVSKLEWKGNL